MTSMRGLFFFIILPLPVILIISIIMAIRDGNTNMNNKHNAKYAFYYLLSLAALIFMALSAGMILFGIIDKTIPDVLKTYSSNVVSSQMRFAISALFISAPIFYYVSSLINKGLHKGELEKDSAIRRWLTYFIILVSSLIILGSFVGVINNFLSGELTSRFILKAASVLLISGVAFSFYFYDVKRENPEKSSKTVKFFFFGTLVLAVAIFVSAWFFVESPKMARARRVDEALVQNMYNLENAVNNYYERNKKLPNDIEELKSYHYAYQNLGNMFDPETKEPIVYQKDGDKEFKMCATFRTSSIVDDGAKNNYYSGLDSNGNKAHLAGYQCLDGNLYVVEAVEAKDAKLVD